MTRVAISAGEDKGLESAVSPHFGRCPYFVLVDLADGAVKTASVVPNPYYNRHQPGQVPGFIHSQQVEVMLTAGMGGRAIAFLKQCGIQAATGASGNVRHALEQYLGHQLGKAEPCHESVEHGHGQVSTTGEHE